MKLIFLLQKDAWFVEYEQSWYRIHDEQQIDIALTALALSVADQFQLVEQPHQAGNAMVEQTSSASIRILLSAPDGDVILDEQLPLDIRTLVSIDWVTRPYRDGWMGANAELSLENVKRLDLEIYLPAAEDSDGKKLTISNTDDGTSSEVWLERDKKNIVHLVQKGGGGKVNLHLDCEPEAVSQSTDSRQLGFVLLGEQVDAA